MSFLRARQRTMTALFPHQANATHLIPKRKQGPIIQSGIIKTVSTTILFDVDIAGGDAAGWTMVNKTTGLPIVVTSAVNGNADEIVLNYALQTVDDIVGITYKPSGWTSARGEVNGFNLERAAIV